MIKDKVLSLEHKLHARRGPKPKNLIMRYTHIDVSGKVTSTKDERLKPDVPGLKDDIFEIKIIATAPKTPVEQRPIDSMTDEEVAEEVQRLEAAKGGKP